MAKTRTLEQAIGAEVARLREAAGVTQDAVAQAAQGFGLEWGQPTISAIESGRRLISVGELALLPHVLAVARVTPQKSPPDRTPEGAPKWTIMRALDLIPDVDEWVGWAEGVEGNLRDARWLLGTVEERERRPKAPFTRAAAPPFTRAMPPTPTRAVAPKVPVTEADRKAARALDLEPEAIAPIARKLWKRGLAEERDQRVGNPSASPQKRGRVTRTLIRELAATVKRRKGR
jgi:transcriptional regulator with XRE-family HTH domain